VEGHRSNRNAGETGVPFSQTVPARLQEKEEEEKYGDVAHKPVVTQCSSYRRYIMAEGLCCMAV
jgi:hypothetical protein